MPNRPGRPCRRRKVSFSPPATYFKPRGIGLRELKIVELSAEELEVIRLKHLGDLDQRQCAERMHTSPATFQRILWRANRKIATALTEGWAIKISQE